MNKHVFWCPKLIDIGSNKAHSNKFEVSFQELCFTIELSWAHGVSCEFSNFPKTNIHVFTEVATTISITFPYDFLILHDCLPPHAFIRKILR